jgi:beta-lactamase regulating signal transducer with metallopeptidase domain
MFIYVGFQYVTNAAQGNAKKIEELHKQLLWLVVGVAVVIGARVIIQVVINTISATNTVSPSIIESANKAIPK